MSGQAEIEDKMLGFRAGGLDYIPKPFQSRELLARVKSQLRIRDQARLLLEQTLELARAHDQLELRVQERTAALQRSQKDLTFKLKELSALNTIARVIADTADPGEMLQQVLETTLSLASLEFKRAGIIFLKDERDPAVLNRIAHVGLAPALVEAERQIAVGHCLCGTCALTGATMITTGIGAAEHSVRYPGMVDHGHVVLPIKSREEVLGVMTMYLEPGRSPSASEVRVLEAIASQLGLALENLRLFRVLEKGKKEWEGTFDAIADLVTINALDHTVLRMNHAAAKVFGGYRSGIGRKFHELLGDERFAAACRTAAGLDAIPRTAAIKGRQYDTSVFPIEESGVPRAFVFVAKDVTERNLAERSLRRQRAFTDNLIQSSSVATFVIDTRHEILIWNRACEELTGHPAAAMIGTADQWKPFYPQRRPVLADVVLDGAAERMPELYPRYSKSVLASDGLQGEGWYYNLNGRDRYLVFDAAPIRDDAGAVIAAVETLQDITDRKRAEEQTAENERRYRQIFESANDMIQCVDADGRILFVNPAWLRTLGYAQADLETIGIFDVLDPECLPHCREVFERLLSGQAVDYFEVTFVGRDGRRVLAEGSATPVVADGRTVSTQAIFHDVSERKRLVEMTAQQMRVAEFESEIGAILNAGGEIASVLKSCTGAIVKHLDAAFARVWTVDDTGAELVLQASSGLYEHTDGPHGRLRVGMAGKVPQVAATGKAILTANIVGDPMVTDQEWAVRESLSSFAGYPLIVEDRVLGVLGMFAKKPLSVLALGALEYTAGNIALAIERARAAASLERYSGELTALNAASDTLMAGANPQEVYQRICDIATSVFAVRLAVLCLVQPGSYDIRPVAHAGPEEGFLSTMRATWDDSHLGSGPCGTAIKTRTACMSSVVDPRFGPWGEEALKRGFRSLLAVPLVSAHGASVGVLVFYSGRADYFSPDRVKLCQIFANQGAVAIENAWLIEGLEAKVLERTREIQQANRELRKINVELEARRLEAEAANRTKSDFLANMSHELRTPLNAIIGFSDLMVRGMAGPLAGDQKEYLGDILGGGQHLLSLINDILDLSKVEAGKMEFEPAEFDLADLVGASLSLFREKALNHAIRLEAHTAAGPERIVADERKVKQVVFNLLANAMKFTPDGGAVSVSTRTVVEDGAGRAEIAVADTGIGMTPEEQLKLFQPFQQLGSHLTKRHEGTGLGLALCRKFVELHGGTITVASAAGRGSTFTVRLPLRPPGQRPEEGGRDGPGVGGR